MIVEVCTCDQCKKQVKDSGELFRVAVEGVSLSKREMGEYCKECINALPLQKIIDAPL